MAKIISQETFDCVVQENIVDFAMSPDEAKEETIKQFEAQGISLANIIKDLTINKESGKPVLNETIDKLKTHLSEQATETEKLHDYLKLLDDEFQKSIAHRVLAGKNGAHDALVTLLESELEKSEPNSHIIKETLKALNSLTNKQPDLFDAEALAAILKIINIPMDTQVICQALRWLQNVCIMHEMNRQRIFNVGIVQQLSPLIYSQPPNMYILKEVLAVFRFLVLDDDVRVEISSAHEHARQIASVYIENMTIMLPKITDLNLLADLILTIGTLAVRQEFCAAIDDAGGLKFIFDIMRANLNSVRVNREALKLLRALAGHDTVKAHIIEQGVAPIIKDLLHTHMDNENVVSAALACISTLTLRVKTNSIAFFETGIAETIVDSIRRHPRNKTVQRNGAWAIRNMVSRCREQCETWLSYGIEDLLNTAMQEHPQILQDIKAALRDLGCKVDLKEEWTGKAEKKIMN